MKKRWFVLLLAAALALAVLLTAQDARLPRPSEKLLAAARGLDDVVIDATFDPESRSLRVIQEMKLVNRTGGTLTAAVLRTWPNAFQTMDHSPCAADEDRFDRYYPDGFSLGALVMERAQVNAQDVFHRYLDEAKTVLNLPVPGSWQPNETIMVSLVYTVYIPRAAYRFGEQDGVWALGNAFAIPAAWEDGAFHTEPYMPVGDSFVSDCMNYDVWVSVPMDYMCAGSGHPTAETVNGRRVYHFDSPAVRDFALVISDHFRTAQAVKDGVLITAYASDQTDAKEMLKYAQKALGCYADLYGSYPWQSCAVAQVGMIDDGAEYPQLIMISSGLQNRELEYAVAHETAHQWWYAAVGSDGYHQPWQDEALCEYSVLDYAEEVYGLSERQELESSRMESAMRVTVSRGVTPGAPLDVYASLSEYKLVARHRGAACLCALDRTVPGGLNGFLRDYYQNYAFLRATREDFEKQLALSTGEDLTPLLRDYLDTNILN